ncbi:hypothetical protein CPB84DRAFT_1674344 [Gymnopilus junonius]|uniref:Endopeptidase S2P n=1 Tax=Gymnopilus junonius TaxID=109634 RepID=A0A9P5TR62_GYMJU|nr:hypothetical protein CPB84DRAFT_1674344 [Gymnopilus junonius]
MSIGHAFLFLAVIWTTIHFLYRIWYRKGVYTLLPAYLGSSAHLYRSTKVSLNALQLKVSTSQWNVHHDRLSTTFTRKANRTMNTLFQAVYNVGIIFSAIGMLVAVGGLVWVSAGSAWTMFQKISLGNSSQSHEASRLVKRLENTEDRKPIGTLPSAQFPGIIPIIPGITVPLSDLPIIILAVFLSQVVHELGHAVAAARETLPIISAGLSFTICIPAAFVTFPTCGMKNLTAKARSRIIAAGPFHNLIFWCFLVLVTHSKVVNIFSVIFGYNNMSDTGKVVVAVNEDSPLSLYLLPGSVITKLDDGPLTLSNDFWTEYLTGLPKFSSLGWCVSRSVLVKSDSCCTLLNTKASPLACFESFDHSERGCLDPVPVLTRPSSNGRCAASKDCSEESTCVIPHEEAQLLRLSVRPRLDLTEETTILWSGPRKEVWEEVQVGNWLPRFRLLPLGFPRLFTEFWNYLTMTTLSLYLFNLLPLAHLDGFELLQSLLDLAFTESSETFVYDIDALEAGEDHLESTRSRRRWKRWFTKYAPILTTGLVLSCIMFAMINVIY